MLAQQFYMIIFGKIRKSDLLHMKIILIGGGGLEHTHTHYFLYKLNGGNDKIL